MATREDVRLLCRLHYRCERSHATQKQRDVWSQMDDVNVRALVEGFTEACKAQGR